MTTLPVVPEDLIRDAHLARIRRSWLHAVTVRVLGTIHNSAPSRILSKTWPDDQDAALILKAPQTQTARSNLPVDVAVGFRSLAPGSALFRLLGLQPALDMAGVNTLKISHVAGLAPVLLFVGEGAPAPGAQWTFAGVTLGPTRKILAVAAVSRELEDAAPETASQVIGRALNDYISRSVDTFGFDAVAGDAVRPPGLLFGVVPIVATAAGAGAMVSDLGNLLDAIGDAGIDPSGSVFVSGPREIGIMRATLAPEFQNSLLMSLGLPPKTLACFAPPALAWGHRGAIEIETGPDAVQHMEDVPGDITATGAPIKSMFQTNLIAIRVRSNCSWVCSPGGAQFIANVAW